MRACVVLDVRLPDLSGLDLQQELGRAKTNIPMVFLTGHGDTHVGARHQGRRHGILDQALQRPGRWRCAP
jgi:FixJ family two-component response regulator